MAKKASDYDPNTYKRIRVEGTRDALIVTFISPEIHSDREIQQVGKELISAVDLAVSVEMPLVVSFRGVKSISSALIGKLVLVNKRAKAAGIRCCLSDLSPAVADVFRRTFPGDGPAGAFAVLKPPPTHDGGHANPSPEDE